MGTSATRHRVSPWPSRRPMRVCKTPGVPRSVLVEGTSDVALFELAAERYRNAMGKNLLADSVVRFGGTVATVVSAAADATSMVVTSTMLFI